MPDIHTGKDDRSGVQLTGPERRLLNLLQEGIPVGCRPFAGAAAETGMTEQEVVDKIRSWLASGVLTRFGPMFNVERLGGEFILVATRVPPERFDELAAVVNTFPEVAHNYERDHELNMWFVTATASPAATRDVLDRISAATGLTLLPMPKEKEFFLEMKLKL